MDLLAVLRRSATRRASRCIGSSPARPEPLLGAGARRPRSASTPTPSACTSTPARGRPGRRRSRAPGHGRPARSTSTRSRRARPGLGFDPPSYTLLAGLLAALAERVGADGDEADRRSGRAWGVEAGRRTRSRSCVKALVAELDRLGFEPGAETTAATAPTSRSCTARSASWPRPIPSWCATCTAGICEGVVTRSAGEASRSSRRCTTATRAGSPSRSEYPDDRLNHLVGGTCR